LMASVFGGFFGHEAEPDEEAFEGAEHSGWLVWMVAGGAGAPETLDVVVQVVGWGGGQAGRSPRHSGECCPVV
jgi:hypothetical protein